MILPRLRSRRLEVVCTRKNGRARRRHARGEGAPVRKAPEIVSRPQNLITTWQPLRQLSKILTERLTSHKQSVVPKSVVHFILGLNISVNKDQLGYLIIERWNNKLMVNTQL